MKAGLHPVETRPARQWRRGVAGDAAIERPLADETPIGLLYDGCPHVVLMATPSDVEDLAVGFTLSERIGGAARTELDPATGFAVITSRCSCEMVEKAAVARAALGPDSGVDWMGLAADYGRIRDGIEATLPDDFAGYNRRILEPGGFRLPVPSSERVWNTVSGKADLIPFRHDDPGQADSRRGDPDVLILTTVRSHDQYNTTVYGLNDRYRGVKGRRDVVFAHPENLAAYYPEANPLLALNERDRKSGAPAYKAMPVRLGRAR